MQTSECKLISLLFYSLSSTSLSNLDAFHPSPEVLPSPGTGRSLSLRREADSLTARGWSRPYYSKLRTFRMLANEPLLSVEVTVSCGSLNLGEKFYKQGENISSVVAPKNSLPANLQILFPWQGKADGPVVALLTFLFCL